MCHKHNFQCLSSLSNTLCFPLTIRKARNLNKVDRLKKKKRRSKPSVFTQNTIHVSSDVHVVCVCVCVCVREREREREGERERERERESYLLGHLLLLVF